MTEGFYTPPESPVSVHSPLQMRLHDIFKRDRGCISLDMGSVSTPCSPTGQSIVTRNVRKSGTTHAISDALEQYELRESSDTVPGLPNVASRGLKRSDSNRIGNRRMSQPHPIKLRTERSPPTYAHFTRHSKIRRTRSAPDLLPKAKKSRSVFQAISAHVGDIAIPTVDYSSEEEEGTDELTSLDTGSSDTSSISSMGKQAILEEIFEEEATFAEALWDHVTMDREELGFRAGDVIEVKDVSDKDWWWGSLGCRSGWFPATFVRLRANQQVTAEDFAQKVKDGSIDSAAVLRRYSVSLLSKEQARTNVVMEIINAEREYVKHLKDMVEGYLEKARKRPEMFSADRLTTIFSNIEEIYHFSRALLHDMERQFRKEAPQATELGCIFLKYRRGFEIYSEYCNNHPQAHEELRTVQKNKKYLHFFEACRLLQQMIEIPLEGFLLTPVQKICKYPLQLAELLKYTRCEHPDYEPLKAALSCMRDIAALINERKRKMESMEKLVAWQESVQDWEGPDLIDQSSELIHTTEVIKINSNGWSQERIFFMFDHQIIYCKKDLLWRDIMVYKGRIDLDNCDIIPLEDGKDTQFSATVKNAIKIHDLSKEKWHLFSAKSTEERDQWLTAFEEERMRIMQDMKSGFNLNDYRFKITRESHRHSSHPEKHKDKNSRRKVGLPTPHHVEYLVKTMPIHATLPRSATSRHSNPKKKAWSIFSNKKTKS